MQNPHSAAQAKCGPEGGPAPLNKIIPLSTVDGPGARTAVFLQGCNIACAYCHNPETQQMCRHCGACVPVCPAGALAQVDGKVTWDKQKCVGCDACLAACPYFASPKITWVAPADVMAAIRPNLPFVRGITVSGGECTLYPEFLTGLFGLAHEAGLTCLIDTNGMVDLQALPGLMAATDGVMLDVKAWDPAVYRALTGAADNHMVKRNLAYLAAAGKLAEVRIVNMPGRVDAADAINGVAEALGKARETVKLKLIAFRPFGVRGQAASAPAPTGPEMDALRAAAEQAGFGHIQIV